jgi:hypothetical protein
MCEFFPCSTVENNLASIVIAQRSSVKPQTGSVPYAAALRFDFEIDRKASLGATFPPPDATYAACGRRVSERS